MKNKLNWYNKIKKKIFVSTFFAYVHQSHIIILHEGWCSNDVWEWSMAIHVLLG